MKKVARFLSYLVLGFSFVCAIGAVLFYLNITWNGTKFVPVDGAYRSVKILYVWLLGFGGLNVIFGALGLCWSRRSSRWTMHTRLTIGLGVGALSVLLGLFGVVIF